jgi:hypothetical protein
LPSPGAPPPPAAQVGNLIVSGEDTLFGLEGEPGREISRDTVRGPGLERGGACGGAGRVGLHRDCVRPLGPHAPLPSPAPQVAEVLVAALQEPSASGKVVEIVSSPVAPALPRDKWFAV